MHARVSSSCRSQVPAGLILRAPPRWSLAQQSPDLQDGKPLSVKLASEGRRWTLGELEEPHSKAVTLLSPNYEPCTTSSGDLLGSRTSRYVQVPPENL
jgi:hypothetical protein